ncbi:hypothetical protein D3C87_1017590 [compost metagenome]
MQYYLFHPALNGACDDNAELLSKFMGIGRSFSHAMELGTEKIRTLEESADEAPLIGLINTLRVSTVDEKHVSVIEKIIKRFGFSLQPKAPSDKAALSMVTLLLNRGRYDVIDQIIDSPTLTADEFKA